MRFVLIDRSHFLSDNFVVGVNITFLEVDSMELKLSGTATVQNVTSEFILEYYLIEDYEENFGFKIDKKERKSGEFVLCEEYVSEYTTSDIEEANRILDVLTKNVVTPTTADNVLQDMGLINYC